MTISPDSPFFVSKTDAGQLIVAHEGEETLEDNFDRFHQDNPHVYDTLVRLAKEWKSKHPAKKCGISLLFEVARWEIALQTKGEPVKLNNNYRAFYARMIMNREPGMSEFFNIRRQKSE